MSVYSRTSFHHLTTREKFYSLNFKLHWRRFSSVRYEVVVYISNIETEEGFNDWNIYVKAPFLKPIIKCYTKLIHFHGTLCVLKTIPQICACTGWHGNWRRLVAVPAECGATSPLFCRMLSFLTAGFRRHRSGARLNTDYVWDVICGFAPSCHAVLVLHFEVDPLMFRQY